MAVTVKQLRDGLTVFDTVAPNKDMMAQAGVSATGAVINNKDGENYLFFANAIDSLRRYAAGSKLIPGQTLYGYVEPLINKMEELDGLIAQERAGVPENVGNPYMMSDLSEALGKFAEGFCVCVEYRPDDFKLEDEDIELFTALDGMVRHLELPVNEDWKDLREAVPAMTGPVAMDDRIFDSMQMHWTAKKAAHDVEVLKETQRKKELAETENGLALQLANSRAAARADVEIRKAEPKAKPSAQSRLYKQFFSTALGLNKYREKYLDQMKEESAEDLKRCAREFLNVEDALAGTDSHLEDVGPDLKTAQKIITEDLWPSVVSYFGSYKPNIRVTGEDATLIRRIHELQEAFCLPEKIGTCDMRQVYNYVQDLDRKEDPDAGVMDEAARFDAFAKKRRFDETEAGKQKLQEEAEKRKLEKQIEEAKLKAVLDELERQKAIAADNEAKRIAEEKAAAELKKKLDEEAAALKIKQQEEAAALKAKQENDERLRKEQEDLEELKKKIPVYKETQEEKEFESLAKEMEAIHKAKKKDEKVSQPEPSAEEKPLPIPDAEGKTWGEFAEELKAYLKQDLNVSGTINSALRIADHPHFNQIVQGLVAINRFVEGGLKDEPVDKRELVDECKRLTDDKGFKKALADTYDNKWLLSHDYRVFWRHVVDASREAYKNTNIPSPFDVSVQEIRQLQKQAEKNRELPFRRNIENIVEQLDNVRYNQDIRKTGFLFFKPSDTGLFQTAAEKLRAIARTNQDDTVRNSDKNEAYMAVKAYLDDRKAVRVHEYGKRRWEKMMCAYAALAPKAEFEQYCRDLNAFRKIEDPMDPDYVSPEAFGPGRMDPENPQLPLREARAQVLREYKQPLPPEAGTADKDLWYFARVAAMRNLAPVKNDWGALVDMKKVDEHARQLVQETSFVDYVKADAFKQGNRAELFAAAEKALAPKRDWTQEIQERTEIVNDLVKPVNIKNL